MHNIIYSAISAILYMTVVVAGSCVGSYYNTVGCVLITRFIVSFFLHWQLTNLVAINDYNTVQGRPSLLDSLERGP